MSADAFISHVEVYQDEGGEFRWRAKASNGETVADSGEGYVDLSWALSAAARAFPEATIVDEVTGESTNQ